jgi:glycosyltransferase involved in cell wall biosynthesis
MTIGPSAGGMHVGFVGNFHPSKSRLGPHSTGFILGLMRLESVESITLFTCPEGRLPTGANPSKVRFASPWRHDDPLSLVRLLASLLSRRNELDIVVFNQYPTAFGNGRLANSLGLLVPILFGALSRTRSVVYMHNTHRTQDLASLGYNATKPTLWILDLLVKLTALTAILIVPLASQSEQLERILKVRSTSLMVPYAEGLPLLLSLGLDAGLPPTQLERTPGTKLRVLFFGSWGPQKDAAALRQIITSLVESGIADSVTIAGSANPAFPQTMDEVLLPLSQENLPNTSLKFDVPDEVVAQLFVESDVVILPYRSTGGASGVMSVAALFDLPVVASDLPQLRETANTLGIQCIFISPDRFQEIPKLLVPEIEHLRHARRLTRDNVTQRIAELQSACQQLLDTAR